MSDAYTSSITYRFRFPDGEVQEFVVDLKERSGEFIGNNSKSLPEWTRLDYKQCRDCPLSLDEHTHCPVAVNMVEVVNFFGDSLSNERATVEVESNDRVTVREDTKLASAMSSLIGIIMATSSCPILDHLRPMARFHQPFSNSKETLYRALSMYACAQYLRRRRGRPGDWEFKGLKDVYVQVNRLNQDFAKRLRNESISEATTNAITNLDCFAQEIDFSISEDMLNEFEVLFAGYLND